MSDEYDDTFKHCPINNLFELCKGHEMITKAHKTSGVEGSIDEMARSLLIRSVLVEEMRRRSSITSARVDPHALLIEEEYALLSIGGPRNYEPFTNKGHALQLVSSNDEPIEQDSNLVDIASAKPAPE